jgi:PEP-CTERM motif
MHRKGSLLSLVALAMFAEPASAATVYAQQADFLSGVAPGSYLETFTLVNSLNAPTFSFGANGFSYTVTAGPPNSGERVFRNGSFISASPSRISLNITFTSGNVTAIGGDFFSGNVGGFSGDVTLKTEPVIVSLSDGTITTFTPTGPASAFRGFISSTPISSVVVQSTQGWYSIMDNLRVGAALPVPEPSTWLMMGLGLIGLAFVKPRKGK